MKLNIEELLDFFDDKKDSQKGDANALMAMFGEDLNAAVYKIFRKNKVEILEESVVQGFQGGKYLDRWILDKNNNILFQCEIKNWAATAIGGRQLKSDLRDKVAKEVVEYYWNRELRTNLSKDSKHFQPNHVTKVLLKMKSPKEYEILKVEPLLIYWMPISKDIKGLNPQSFINIKELGLKNFETEFDKLQIFSVSLYLRQLYKNGKGQNFIDLEMPHFEHRMKILDKLQSKK